MEAKKCPRAGGTAAARARLLAERSAEARSWLLAVDQQGLWTTRRLRLALDLLPPPARK